MPTTLVLRFLPLRLLFSVVLVAVLLALPVLQTLELYANIVWDGARI